jgi:hypothetical protein
MNILQTIGVSGRIVLESRGALGYNIAAIYE